MYNTGFSWYLLRNSIRVVVIYIIFINYEDQLFLGQHF